jgi:hypothetical protein
MEKRIVRRAWLLSSPVMVFASAYLAMTHALAGEVVFTCLDLTMTMMWASIGIKEWGRIKQEAPLCSKTTSRRRSVRG